MAKEIILPRLGNSVEACIITRWNKAIGDSVAIDEVLCEVETDKTTMDVLSTEEGILRYQCYAVDAVVQILAPIAIVGSADEAIDELVAALAFQSTAEIKAHNGELVDAHNQGEPKPTASIAVPMDEDALVHNNQLSDRNVTPANSAEATGPYRLSPRAKRYLNLQGLSADAFLRHFPLRKLLLACRASSNAAGKNAGKPLGEEFLEEQDVVCVLSLYPSFSPTALRALTAQDRVLMLPKDIANTIGAGSGINGRILEQDIAHITTAILERGRASAQTTEIENDCISAAANQSGYTANYMLAMRGFAEHNRTSIKAVRKIIAERMIQSLASTAQLTLHMQAKASKLQQVRAHYKRNNIAVSINDIIASVVVQVLRKELWANSLLVDNNIISYQDINLGIAMQGPRGLMVPVVAKANGKDVQSLAKAIKILAVQCKDGSISPDALQGGTFTITNLGVYGVQNFTPILNAPQTGILGIGSIDISAARLPDGSYGFEPRISLSLSFDHRAYDGADAARLLRAFADGIAEYEI